MKSSKEWGASFLKLYVLHATPIPAQLTAISSLWNLFLATSSADITSASLVTYLSKKKISKILSVMRNTKYKLLKFLMIEEKFNKEN